MKIVKTCCSTLAVTICVASFGAKPYDAEVEYLDANATSGATSYFDTGILPADDVGALVRFSPKQSKSDSVLFGARASDDTRWYFGGPSSGFYFGRSVGNTAAAYRPTNLAVGSVYDVRYTHFNERAYRVSGVDGSTFTYSGSTTNECYIEASTWSCSGTPNPIHLFGHCVKSGTHTTNGNWYRIYFAQFTKGGKIVKDLIPVRVGSGADAVGYMYDKVSGTLIEQQKLSDTAPAFALGGDVAGESYIAGTITLDNDADWTARGMLHFESDAVIDLNGHSLTIVGAFGDGTITDSSSGAPGELHIVTPPFSEIESSLALTGNMKVVKEGEGSLALIRKNQTFTGGVVVAGGTAYAPKGANKNSYAESNSYWGPSGGTITVMPGATFDNKGNAGYASKQFILAGGTLANTGHAMSSFDAGIFSHIKLTEDSFLNAESAVHIWANGDATSCVDLGGHTLSVSIGYSITLYLNTVVSNGTMDVVSGGYLRPSTKSGTVINHGSDTLDLRMTGGALNITDDMPVHDYYAGYNKTYNGGTSKLLVHGTFTPAAIDDQGKECFYGCTMQRGSCIDLSQKTTTWDTTSAGFTGGSRTVTFEDGANVAIDIHGRTPAKGEQIVSWTTPPANLATLTFTWDAATTALGKQIYVTDDGIYYDISATDVATAHWTGALGDNDTANPLNWACTNYLNAPVSGVPMGSTDVYISGDIAIRIDADHPLVCNSIYFSNARLTADCDWSGLKEWTTPVTTASITDIGSIDLNGHKLRLVAVPTTGKIYDDIRLAVTDGSSGAPGELYIEVPLADSDLVCNGFTLSGNLKLVKDGAGKIAMTKAWQTFAGGVLVNEGTAYSAGSKQCPENENYWGADGGTITVKTNATFDVCGNTNYLNKTFVLDGGTLATSSSMGNTSEGIGNVRLIADSFFKMTAKSLAMTFSAPTETEKIDLGGYTLSVAMMGSCHLYLPLPVENGTLLFNGTGGYLHIKEATAGGSQTLNLEMVKSAMYIEGEFSVSNYVARYTDNYNSGAGTLKVYGTFTPAAQRSGNDAFFGQEMQDGAKIDLSSKTTAFGVVGLGFTNEDSNRTMTFENGATVGVLLGTRKLANGARIIDWSAAVPENRAGLKFIGLFADGRRINLMVRDDGLYVPKKGLMLIVR